MDPAILSATAGLIGSVVGGVSTFAASWLTQRGQLRLQTLVQQAAKREALYADGGRLVGYIAGALLGLASVVPPGLGPLRTHSSWMSRSSAPCQCGCAQRTASLLPLLVDERAAAYRL